MNTDKHTVFVSYCHNNNNDHLQWVLHLAQRISVYGIPVILDQQGLGAGDNKYQFMDPLIQKAGKVVIIFTPEYKFKAENRIGGVGYEYSLITEDLYRTMLSNKKYIPVLRSGTVESSIPVFMRQFIAVDMREPSRFETGLQELMAAMLDRPPAGEDSSVAGSFRGTGPLSGNLAGSRVSEGVKPDDRQSFLAELGMLSPLIGMGKDLLSAALELPGHELPGHELPGHETPGHDLAGRDPAGHDLAAHDLAGHDLTGHDPAGHELPDPNDVADLHQGDHFLTHHPDLHTDWDVGEADHEDLADDSDLLHHDPTDT